MPNIFLRNLPIKSFFIAHRVFTIHQYCQDTSHGGGVYLDIAINVVIPEL